MKYREIKKKPRKIERERDMGKRKTKTKKNNKERGELMIVVERETS